MEYDKLLNLGAELGQRLMFSGAEIYRVEESVVRLLTAYDQTPQVFAIPNCLIVSLNTPDGRSLTRMCRIPAHGTDIELLERCNDLCRRLCREHPDVECALEQVLNLDRGLRRFPTWVVALGYLSAAAFFSLFFGGGVLDCLCAAMCGLAVGCCVLYGQPFTGSNLFFRTVICAALASGLALVLVYAGVGYNLEAITIGTLMVLVPGMALTNAMREIMAGDIFSGVNRTAEVLLVATAIALGTAVPLMLGTGLSSAESNALLPGFFSCLWAFFACVGFGLVFNIQGRGILICGLGAALGWLVYLLTLEVVGSDILCAFLAAMSVGAYSEVMARLRRCPVTGYLQVALLPLVPGAGIYYAMSYCVSGYTNLFLSTLLHTIGFAAALSVGAMLMTSLLRALLPRVWRVGR
ncbi:MAG: threonine/serine ThrE exporter family protein [Lawsonibacter sp.]|jgi:uncharacterized membrane protein YjjP (DUF1212 family)